MKFTAVLAFLAFATTTFALPADPINNPQPPCKSGCPRPRVGGCPPDC
ncbi:hypothetical protein Vi05172_g12754 [Venturia inaequalis]|nr:hypothetical protein Vi05172_g12754 [Venturia inaequalis]